MDVDDEIANSNPLMRAGHVAISLGNYLLIWGGYRDRIMNVVSRYLPTNQIWIYDTLLGKWRLEYTKGSNPPGTSGPGSVLLDDKLYILGGYCDEYVFPDGNTNAVYELDLPTRTWTKLGISGDLPLPCDKMTCWTHDGKIFIFGGFGLNPNLYRYYSSTEKFDFVSDESSDSLTTRGWNNQLVIFDPNTNTWSWPKCKGTKPIARAAHASAKLGDKVYIFGGRHQHTRMNDMHYLNLSTMTWSGRLPVSEPIPIGRSWHSLNALNSVKLVLFGGFSQIREALSDAWIFDTRTLSWTRVVKYGLQPRLWHSACLTDQGELLVIGGCTENILSNTTTYANSLLTLYFSPKSLFRISLDNVLTNRHLLEPLWSGLPQSIQSILQTKTKLMKE